MMNKIWEITKDGVTNRAVGPQDIWSGTEGVSVTEVGPAPSPASRPVKPAYDLYRALTVTERKAIRQAAKSNDDMEEFKDSLDKAVSAGRILETHTGSEVDLALDALVTATILTSQRKAEIVA